MCDISTRTAHAHYGVLRLELAVVACCCHMHLHLQCFIRHQLPLTYVLRAGLAAQLHTGMMHMTLGAAAGMEW